MINKRNEVEKPQYVETNRHAELVSASPIKVEIAGQTRNDGSKACRVYINDINDTQYFDNVPLAAWNFYIDGYQPAQKWLKDRKSRTLNYEDIRHYQKMIVALNETGEVMGEIDKIMNKENALWT